MPDAALNSPVEVLRPEASYAALGASLEYLSRKPPFARYEAARLIRSVEAQIKLGACLIARDGSRLVGYFGWSLHSAESVAEFARMHEATARLALPPVDPGDPTPFGWVTIVAAEDGAILRALARAARKGNPGRRILGVRQQRGALRAVPPTKIMDFETAGQT